MFKKNQAQKKASNSALNFAQKGGKAAAKQALETIKFIARLVLKKIIALILFLITKVTFIILAVLIPLLVIVVIFLTIFGTAGTLLLTSYLADDETLSRVTVYYSDKERELSASITEEAIKSAYGVDEVNYLQVDNFGHRSHLILSYLTAKYQNFTFPQVKDELDIIFSLQYQKTITVRKIEVEILDKDGNGTGIFETRKIADLTLINNSLHDILLSRLSSDEQEHFLLLLEVNGNRQYGDFPMDWDWLTNITDDFNNRNKGVEAEVPNNTPVYGTINGKIISATTDSVSIDGKFGEDTIIITFSRLNSVTVNVGDSVRMSTIIGYTTDRIFIQIQRNGVFINPILFLGSQRQELNYGTNQPPLTQSEYNQLVESMNKVLGTPYVFGGQTPGRGIDCSAFVWWAINDSGIKSWSRTTAQGQFNQCDSITLADVRPGDLIFFEKTYDTTNAVSHIGVYLGNGMMHHSGSPNKIESFQTSYWQNHFCSFGRLRH